MMDLRTFIFFYYRKGSLLDLVRQQSDTNRNDTGDFNDDNESKMPDTASTINIDFPLYVAAGMGDLKTVKLLIEGGCNYAARTNFGHTALHAAALFGTPKVVHWLIGSPCYMDVNCMNRDGQSLIEEILEDVTYNPSSANIYGLNVDNNDDNNDDEEKNGDGNNNNNTKNNIIAMKLILKSTRKEYRRLEKSALLLLENGAWPGNSYTTSELNENFEESKNSEDSDDENNSRVVHSGNLARLLHKFADSRASNSLRTMLMIPDQAVRHALPFDLSNKNNHNNNKNMKNKIQKLNNILIDNSPKNYQNNCNYKTTNNISTASPNNKALNKLDSPGSLPSTPGTPGSQFDFDFLSSSDDDENEEKNMDNYEKEELTMDNMKIKLPKLIDIFRDYGCIFANGNGISQNNNLELDWGDDINNFNNSTSISLGTNHNNYNEDDDEEKNNSNDGNDNNNRLESPRFLEERDELINEVRVNLQIEKEKESKILSSHGNNNNNNQKQHQPKSLSSLQVGKPSQPNKPSPIKDNINGITPTKPTKPKYSNRYGNGNRGGRRPTPKKSLISSSKKSFSRNKSDTSQSSTLPTNGTISNNNNNNNKSHSIDSGPPPGLTLNKKMLIKGPPSATKYNKLKNNNIDTRHTDHYPNAFYQDNNGVIRSSKTDNINKYQQQQPLQQQHARAEVTTINNNKLNINSYQANLTAGINDMPPPGLSPPHVKLPEL